MEKLNINSQSKIKQVLLLACSCFILVACNQQLANTNTRKGSSNFAGNDSGGSNSTLDYGRVMKHNPVVAMGGKDRVESPIDLSRFSNQFSFITEDDTLESCKFNFDDTYTNVPKLYNGNTFGCFKVVDEFGNTLSKESYQSWDYNANSKEFLQVNTFYHAQLSSKKFLNSVVKIMDTVHFGMQGFMIGAYPQEGPLFSPSAYWLTQLSPSLDLSNKTLTIRPLCNVSNNASYSSATFEVCLGYVSTHNSLFIAQDPSIIYHEMGHAFVDIFMNARNSSFPYKVTMGSLFYDEAGSINEGIADYFSYVMTQRDTMGEWGLGKYLEADRPLSETSHVHNSYIKDVQGARLSYPEYLNYDVYNDTKPIEDVHYSGQIVSHFLTRLTGELGQSCNMSTTQASEYVFAMIGETLSYLGDLTAKGSDYNESEYFLNNLNENNAYEWSMITNPPNFRRFFQVFSKNILYHVLVKHCFGQYTQDQYEQLLDSYGLLLFSSYDDDLDATDASFDFDSLPMDIINIDNTSRMGLTNINFVNRQKTTLIGKQYIDIISEQEASQNSSRPVAYIFDNAQVVNNALTGLVFEGNPPNITSPLAGTEYNNSNIRISPGEVVGVSLNLVNNSNAPMAGVQILANDWDHMKYTDGDIDSTLKPCKINNYPTIAQGAAANDDDPLDPMQGDCAYTTRNNGDDDFDINDNIDPAVPICMVEYRSTNSVEVLNQDEYRSRSGIQLNECLNNSDPKNSNRNLECLVRVLKPTQQAFYSKLDPQKTLTETLSTNGSVPLNSSSVVFMEVNKWIPPGTAFICRFRVRFNNCSDCFEDSEMGYDEFNDYEYSGSKPYKVINFRFVVID